LIRPHEVEVKDQVSVFRILGTDQHGGENTNRRQHTTINGNIQENPRIIRITVGGKNQESILKRSDSVTSGERDRPSIDLLILVPVALLNPDHAARVYEGFYGLPGLGELAFQVLGGLEAALLLGFLFGVRKRFTYGMVLALHAVSTFASYAQYLEPFDHLLFFAAWPMLAACLALYLLRDQDTWLTL